jgi:NADPH-dependent curcumin reductase CurA
MVVTNQSGSEKRMRAYVVEQAGAAFTLVDRPRPDPGEGQVLVRVHASGVNPLDAKIRAGNAAHARQPLSRPAPALRVFILQMKSTAWSAALEVSKARWPSLSQ